MGLWPLSATAAGDLDGYLDGGLKAEDKAIAAMEIRFRSAVAQGPVADRSLFELNHSAECNVQLGGCLEICWYWTNHVELKLTRFAEDCAG